MEDRLPSAITVSGRRRSSLLWCVKFIPVLQPRHNRGFSWNHLRSIGLIQAILSLSFNLLTFCRLPFPSRGLSLSHISNSLMVFWHKSTSRKCRWTIPVTRIRTRHQSLSIPTGSVRHLLTSVATPNLPELQAAQIHKASGPGLNVATLDSSCWTRGLHRRSTRDHSTFGYPA